MISKKFTNELKMQVVAECQRIGNIALVARKYEISDKTVYGWIAKSRKQGSLEPIPQDKGERNIELEKRLSTISNENDRLKRIVAEKELELAILRELRDKVNPR